MTAKAAEVASPPTPDPTLAGVERLRETAKWLIGAYAAVGAAIVAGLQLTSLGKVEDKTHLLIAAIAAGVALFAIVLAIAAVARVLTPIELKKGDLIDASLVGKMAEETSGLLMAQANGLTELQKTYDDVAGVYQKAVKDGGDTPADKALVKHAHERVIEVLEPLEEMRHIALFLKVNERFSDAKRVLLGSAVVTIVGILVFAWAANPSEESQATAKAQEHGPTLAAPSSVSVSIEKSRSSLAPLVAALGGSKCDLQHVAALVVGGSPADPEVVTLPQKGCKTVRFTISQGIGVPLPAKEGSSVTG